MSRELPEAQPPFINDNLLSELTRLFISVDEGEIDSFFMEQSINPEDLWLPEMVDLSRAFDSNYIGDATATALGGLKNFAYMVAVRHLDLTTDFKEKSLRSHIFGRATSLNAHVQVSSQYDEYYYEESISADADFPSYSLGSRGSEIIMLSDGDPKKDNVNMLVIQIDMSYDGEAPGSVEGILDSVKILAIENVSPEFFKDIVADYADTVIRTLLYRDTESLGIAISRLRPWIDDKAIRNIIINNLNAYNSRQDKDIGGEAFYEDKDIAFFAINDAIESLNIEQILSDNPEIASIKYNLIPDNMADSLISITMENGDEIQYMGNGKRAMLNPMDNIAEFVMSPYILVSALKRHAWETGQNNGTLENQNRRIHQPGQMPKM